MNEERVQTLMGLEERLGWYFADIALLDNALTHRSFVNENAALACRDNERLEFLKKYSNRRIHIVERLCKCNGCKRRPTHPNHKYKKPILL